MGRVFTLYDETKAEKPERRPSRTDAPEWPGDDSGFACGPSGYGGTVAGISNGHQWTPQSHLEVFVGTFGRTPILQRASRSSRATAPRPSSRILIDRGARDPSLWRIYDQGADMSASCPKQLMRGANDLMGQYPTSQKAPRW